MEGENQIYLVCLYEHLYQNGNERPYVLWPHFYKWPLVVAGLCHYLPLNPLLAPHSLCLGRALRRWAEARIWRTCFVQGQIANIQALRAIHCRSSQR